MLVLLCLLKKRGDDITMHLQFLLLPQVAKNIDINVVLISIKNKKIRTNGPYHRVKEEGLLITNNVFRTMNKVYSIFNKVKYNLVNSAATNDYFHNISIIFLIN